MDGTFLPLIRQDFKGLRGPTTEPLLVIQPKSANDDDDGDGE